MNSVSDKSLNPGDAGAAQKAPSALESLLGEDPGIKGLDELIGKIEPLLAGGAFESGGGCGVPAG
ncbi:hypothetical protein [Alcaligenes faecalis]|uniref:hypothetical protein n=1 Tax=Alcaligenes faecalis TaxID=511 RepID=UPI002933D8EB|nr:hypothetical protein [Alcaligenes faecalis]MDV2115778.1 hypothetical protein [Alcaligenes faecalis]